ncbi:MAG: ATP-dependent RNA helicase HrpA [Phycisphaerae bacterium]|nr:ATP-dependent RNA helicase HrpA [Phycisphaerae bacterium]
MSIVSPSTSSEVAQRPGGDIASASPSWIRLHNPEVEIRESPRSSRFRGYSAHVTERRRRRRKRPKEASVEDPGALEPLRGRIREVVGPRRHILERRLDGVARAHAQGRDMARAITSIGRDLDRFQAGQTARKSRNLKVGFPEELPISRERSLIASAIREHQVVVVCGETGSGKTTQLPKICLELGRGIDGVIGHPQPRRVAARSVAARISEELATPLGTGVGYAVRFNDRTAPDTRIKLMTDGILLAETARDRDLLAYDTIIVDEAHERSLNIDFLLGYLKRLLPRRPDLKVVVTSATIDPERFSRHFNGAPIISVEGRTHPVDLRYRPPSTESGDPDDALIQGILEGIREIDDAGLEIPEPSGRPDILVFLPGEREIRDVTAAIDGTGFPETETLPLYARLSNEQQDRVFKPGPRRRIVLATNVAETSLTVPRIRGVIDSGLARIARYSPRRRVQRLPIEPVSRASAAQRAGRCGRIAPGVCIRLSEEAAFLERPEFTAPEISRSNLASVILRMADLGLGEPEAFPFVETPSAKLIRDGFETLHELGAVDRGRTLTEVGRDLAALPVDPRIGRMVLASIDEACLGEILAVASALTVPDPRLRTERKGTLGHAIFRDPSSDFLGFVRLWRAWRDARAEKGSSALRTWCRRHDLSFLRMREWQDIHDQLAVLARDLLGRRGGASGQDRKQGRRNQPRIPEVRDDPPAGAIHRAILSGLVSHVGRRGERGEYHGINGGTFEIFPGSVLRRQESPWIVAAEIVETSRRWGRTCARIHGDWIEKVAPHLVRRTHFEPHFVPETGFVSAYERVSCGDLDTTERRRVPYAPIDARAARQVFINEALVAARLDGEPGFLEANRITRERLESLSDRGREIDLVGDEDRQFRFYDTRLPDEIHNVPAFEAWRRQAERRDPQILRMKDGDLLDPDRIRPDAAAYPDRIEVAGVDVPLRYRHEPGHPADGVTAMIPLELLGRLDPRRFDWLVPGLLHDKIETLIRSLPRRMRTRFMPISETAAGAAEHLRFGEAPILRALAGYLSTIGGSEIRPADFRLEMLERHHFMRFELLDADGRTLSTTRRFEDLLASHRDRARAAFEASVEISADDGDDEASTLAAIRARRDWDFGSLPSEVRIRRGGATLPAFPAVADEGRDVRVRVTDDRTTATELHRRGVLRLLSLGVGDALRHHLEHLPGLGRLTLLASPLGPSAGFVQDLGDLAVAVAVSDDSGSGGELAAVRDREVFLEFDDRVRRDLWPALERACDLVEPILESRQTLLEEIDQPGPATWETVRRDERRHVEHLVPPGFASRIPPDRLAQLPRYLEASRRRLDRLRGSGLQRDEARREEFEGWRRLLASQRRRLAEVGRIDPRVDRFGWLLEEYRVHLFAQELGNPIRISPAALKAAWRELGG